MKQFWEKLFIKMFIIMYFIVVFYVFKILVLERAQVKSFIISILFSFLNVKTNIFGNHP